MTWQVSFTSNCYFTNVVCLFYNGSRVVTVLIVIHIQLTVKKIVSSATEYTNVLRTGPIASL